MATTLESTVGLRHPLEPLSVGEIAAAVDILRSERQLGERVRFVTISLHEPPKAAVLAFPSAGPVDRSEHDYAMWEKRVDALMVVLSSPRHGLLKVDELRRHIEGLGADAYDAMSYYERWMAAISATLIERGL